MGLCGGDDNDEKVARPERTAFQRFTEKAMALAFFALAIYTIISLFNALNQVSRTDLVLSDSYPSDRCLPMFDSIQKFKTDTNDVAAGSTKSLYDYRAGEAVARVCTTSTVAAVLDKVGSNFAYDPWISDGGCDVLNNAQDKADFIANCETTGLDAAQSQNCADMLNYTPGTYGVHWNHYIQKLTGNKTLANGTSVPYGRCAMKISRISGISNCTLASMVPLHDLKANIRLLIQLGCVIPFLVMLVQTYCVYQYDKDGAKQEDGHLLAFALRGIPGPIYQVYWFFQKEGNEHGEFPRVYLSWWGWLICVISDGMEGIVVPLVAILGCFLGRFPVNLALLALKILKMLLDTGMFLYHRNEEQEPGNKADQDVFWNVKQQELDQKNASPVHTSTTAA